MPGADVRTAGGADSRWWLPRHVVLFDMRATCQSMASSLFLLWGLVLLISYCVTVLRGVHNNAEDSHH